MSCKDQSAVTVPLTVFSPQEHSLEDMGLERYPFDDIIAKQLAAPVPDGWTPSGVDRDAYLDMIEKIVRMAATWVNDSGAVIDPYFKAEFGQTTPRFVSSASVLLHFRPDEDLKPIVTRAMTYACTRLANGVADSPDFWMRELTTAFICLRPISSKESVSLWESLLKEVNPEATYRVVDPTREKLGQLHNWAVYSAGGEYVRDTLGLTSSSGSFLQGQEFFDTYMEPQLVHFTKEGMYRDPNDPITYDITTRLQIANALAYGYDGKLKDKYNELLRRGGLSMLLFISPNGVAPYGGRSGQFQFQEGIIAALSELEASRYKASNPRLAGAFKRQAHLSAIAMRRWIMDMEPLRHIKNGFSPEHQHGIDGYGKYSVYALYCSSVLGLATLYADDTINEAPCFSETGGYLFEISPAFHKIFATAKDSHVEIDTQADLHHESTGLGRFHVKDAPVELGLSMSFTATPKYSMADSLKPSDNYAIGPVWKSGGKVFSLASLSENLTHEVTPMTVGADTVAFKVRYNAPVNNGTAILQQYTLAGRNLKIVTAIEGTQSAIDSVYFTVPLLVSTGLSETNIIDEPGKVTVQYLGHRYIVEFAKGNTFNIDTKLFANRNGIYRNLIIGAKGHRMQVSLTLE